MDQLNEIHKINKSIAYYNPANTSDSFTSERVMSNGRSQTWSTVMNLVSCLKLQ